jgi:hypothetical protein
LTIGADIGHAGIIAPDDDNVGFLVLPATPAMLISVAVKAVIRNFVMLVSLLRTPKEKMAAVAAAGSDTGAVTPWPLP